MRHREILGRFLANPARLEQIGIVILVALGLALRLRQYLFNRPIWLDEAMLALNVIDRDFGRLLSTRMHSNQSAPPGFLVAARSIVEAFGPYDWALRLLPLAAGILLVL